jgi:poly-beta-hydroxyalkanoate depolymerase
MTVTPRVRRLALTAHIACSVGWLGAVAAFLALAIVALTSEDGQTVRGAYLVMKPAAWLVLAPLAFGSLLTGLVQALVTTWGLFRHYWVVFKLLINVVATFFLLLYMETFSSMAHIAGDARVDLEEVRNPSPALHAAVALILLLVATTLAVFKPRGVTPFGRGPQRAP